MVSAFLETVTVVRGTPQKTEWVGYNDPKPAPSENSEWRRRWHKQTLTTLVDVQYLGGSHQKEISFYHNPDGASCGIRPRLAAKDWFVLNKDEEQKLKYSLCTATHVPIGAILDYQLNGNDVLVPLRPGCSFLKTYAKSVATFDESQTANIEKRLSGWNCAFWDEGNQTGLNNIRKKYETRQRQPTR